MKASTHYAQKWVKLNHPEFRMTPANPSYVPGSAPTFSTVSRITRSAPRNNAPGYEGVGVNSPGPKFNSAPGAFAMNEVATFQNPPPPPPTFNVNSGRAELKRNRDELTNRKEFQSSPLIPKPDVHRAETSSAQAQRTSVAQSRVMTRMTQTPPNNKRARKAPSAE